MQRRKFMIAIAAFAALALGQSSAQAAFNGNINITDSGTTSATGSTATGVTSVTFTNLFTLNAVGSFTGEGFKNLGGATLTVANPSAFKFGVGTSFGEFDGQSLIVQQTSATSETIYVLGTYTPGSDFPSGTTGGAASFIFSITQGATGAYSVSGNLSLPPVPIVPEPASVVMLGLGIVGFGGVALRRRSAK